MRKMFGFGLVAAVAVVIVLSVSVAKPALAQGPFLVGVNSTTNVYDAPNLNANLIGQLLAGQNWFVMGTDTTGNWVEVQVTTSINGWAPKSALGVSGLPLPVIAGVTGGSVTSGSATAAATVATTASTAAATTVAPVSTSSAPVTVPYLVVVQATTNAYDSPSTKGNVIGVLTLGQTWFVLGTDTTGKWTEVQVAGTSTVFWAPTSTLSLSGVTLPVIPGVTGS